MAMLRNTALLFGIGLLASPTLAQEDDINSAENAAYRNFDFIAGTKTLFYDDLTTGLGKWRIIEHDGSEEVEPPGIRAIGNPATSWFKTPRRGVFYPKDLKPLPNAFTVEFDLWADTERMSEMESGLIVAIVANNVNKEDYSTAMDEHPQVQIDIHPSAELLYCTATKENIDGERLLDRKDIRNGWTQGKAHRVSISRNGTHIKVYVGEKKFIDLPHGLPVAGSYTLIMATNMWGDGLYFKDLRIAGSTPTAPTIDAEHKFVTTAIHFNVNSAVIKPESWPALAQAASAIGSTKSGIRIVGHTDSNGHDADNLALSQRRAEAVKAFLIKHFGIEAARLTTEGQGEANPVDDNSTAEGKANNRRVEFIAQ